MNKQQLEIILDLYALMTHNYEHYDDIEDLVSDALEIGADLNVNPEGNYEYELSGQWSLLMYACRNHWEKTIVLFMQAGAKPCLKCLQLFTSYTGLSRKLYLIDQMVEYGLDIKNALNVHIGDTDYEIHIIKLGANMSDKYIKMAITRNVPELLPYIVKEINASNRYVFIQYLPAQYHHEFPTQIVKAALKGIYN